MNSQKLSRRSALERTGLLVGGAVLGSNAGSARAAAKAGTLEADRPFRYCLNMATIRGQKLGVVKEIEVAAQAGYDAVEPWIESIGDYVKNGGALSDLKKRIDDAGPTGGSAI